MPDKDDSSENPEGGIKKSILGGSSAFFQAIGEFWKAVILIHPAIARRWRAMSEFSKASITLFLGALLGPLVQSRVANFYTYLMTIESFSLPILQPGLPEYFLPVNVALWFLTLVTALNSLDPTSLKVQDLEQRIDELEEELDS